MRRGEEGPLPLAPSPNLGRGGKLSVGIGLFWLVCAVGDAAVVIEAPLQGLDPQSVLLFGQIPLGGAGSLRVSGGDGPLEIDASSAVRLDETVSGGPSAVITTEELVRHLTGIQPLIGDELVAADVNRSGEVDVADLVRVVIYGGSFATGDDPRALIVARPDGRGALDEDDLLDALGLKTVRDGGNSAGQINLVLEPNLMSLTPSRLTVFPGESFTVDVQIDSAVNAVDTVEYQAGIHFNSAQVAVNPVPEGAEENEDFEDRPTLIGLTPTQISFEDSVSFRSDVGEPVINVANVEFTVNIGVAPGTLIGFRVHGRSSMTPLGDDPVLPPQIKVLGCAVRVGP